MLHKPLRFLYLSLAAFLAAAPMASSQALFYEDARGDVVLDVGGAETPLPFDTIDLTGLAIDETTDAFRFTISVADLSNQPGGVTSAEASYYQIRFTNDGARYEVFVNRPYGSDYALADLYRYDDQVDDYRAVVDLPVTYDASGFLAVEVDRALLVDADGLPPTTGDVLADVTVASISHVTNTAGVIADSLAGQDVRAGDLMPDQEQRDYRVLLGGIHAGTARLSSDEPFRASNGESGSFLYDVRAINNGTQGDLFQFTVADAPEGWDVFLPEEDVWIGGGEAVDLPVLVVMPFVHSHGSTQAATILMESIAAPENRATLEIGVHYLQTPQPAGHHSRLWIHAESFETAAATVNPLLGSTDGRLFMNTLEEDPASTAEGVDAFNRVSGTESAFEWTVYLNPGLVMGLDFDLDGEGHLSVPVSTTQPLEGVHGTAKLVLLSPTEDPTPPRYAPYGGREVTVLAEGEADVGGWQANEERLLELSIQPAQGADLIPYVAGQDLVLELRLHATGVFAKAPRLHPGGTLDLPLVDYSDPVTEIYNGLGPLRLDAVQGQEQSVNPGETALFDVRLSNEGSRKETVQLTLRGPGAAWATSNADEVVLQPGDSTTIQVAVRAPDDAVDGQRVDMVLEVASKQGSIARSLVRLAVLVDTDQDHVDRAGDVLPTASTKDTPAPLALPALAAAALAGRGLSRRGGARRTTGPSPDTRR